MSLINVAQQVRGPRTLTHTVLAVIAVAVGIIAGLLAMHSFNSHATTAGHHDTVAVSTQADVSAHHHDTSEAAAVPDSPTADAGCATCGGGDPMTWMACVLALLVATILLGRIGLVDPDQANNGADRRRRHHHGRAGRHRLVRLPRHLRL